MYVVLPCSLVLRKIKINLLKMELINSPTHMTLVARTLLDLILTNASQSFNQDSVSVYPLKTMGPKVPSH